MGLPGRGLNLGLACENSYKHPDVEVNTDAEQRHDVALVAVGVQIQAVQYDPQGLWQGWALTRNNRLGNASWA